MILADNKVDMRAEGGADLTHRFMFSSRPGRAGGNIKTWRDQSDQLTSACTVQVCM